MKIPSPLTKADVERAWEASVLSADILEELSNTHWSYDPILRQARQNMLDATDYAEKLDNIYHRRKRNAKYK